MKMKPMLDSSVRKKNTIFKYIIQTHLKIFKKEISYIILHSFFRGLINPLMTILLVTFFCQLV